MEPLDISVMAKASLSEAKCHVYQYYLLVDFSSFAGLSPPLPLSRAEVQTISLSVISPGDLSCFYKTSRLFSFTPTSPFPKLISKIIKSITFHSLQRFGHRYHQWPSRSQEARQKCYSHPYHIVFANVIKIDHSQKILAFLNPNLQRKEYCCYGLGSRRIKQMPYPLAPILLRSCPGNWFKLPEQRREKRQRRQTTFRQRHRKIDNSIWDGAFQWSKGDVFTIIIFSLLFQLPPSQGVRCPALLTTRIGPIFLACWHCTSIPEMGLYKFNTPHYKKNTYQTLTPGYIYPVRALCPLSEVISAKDISKKRDFTDFRVQNNNIKGKDFLKAE